MVTRLQKRVDADHASETPETERKTLSGYRKLRESRKVLLGAIMKTYVPDHISSGLYCLLFENQIIKRNLTSLFGGELCPPVVLP